MSSRHIRQNKSSFFIRYRIGKNNAVSLEQLYGGKFNGLFACFVRNSSGYSRSFLL
jgi:hypothetical protein